MWNVCQRGNCGITQSARRGGSKEEFVAKALRAQTDRAVTYWLSQGKIQICLDFVFWFFVGLFCGIFLL